MHDALGRLFDDYDLVCTPTLAISNVENGTTGPDKIDGQSVAESTDWFLMFPFDLGGSPTASVPAGQTKDGLPVGLQIATPRIADDLVLAASAALERSRPWMDAYPMR